MEQTKALNALEPFLALTKSANSPRAAADLITKATSAPNTYIFTSLFQAPQIQALHDSDQSSYLRLLEIFSYGSFADYNASTTTLPQLNSAQLLKLRQLSLLSLAEEPENLTYACLIAKLGLGNKKELEDLVVSAIYANLLTATLDPQRQSVIVSSIAPLRDVPKDNLSSMIEVMKEWEARCTNTLSSLEAQIKTIKEDAVKRASAEKIWNDKLDALRAKADKDIAAGFTRPSGGAWPRSNGGGSKGKGVSSAWPDRQGMDGPSDEDEAMDIDDDDNNNFGPAMSRANKSAPLLGKGAKKRGHGTMH